MRWKPLITGIAIAVFFVGVYPLASRAVMHGAARPEQLKTSRQAPKTRTPSADTVSKKADKQGPIGVFAMIERGWKSRDVNKILEHFGKGKVAISINGIGPSGGSFSKNQSYYLFKDLFKYTITKKFEFVQYRNVTNGQRKVYAVAERYYKRSDDGRLFKDKIYVSLQLEGQRWVISEIKSIH